MSIQHIPSKYFLSAVAPKEDKGEREGEEGEEGEEGKKKKKKGTTSPLEFTFNGWTAGGGLPGVKWDMQLYPSDNQGFLGRGEGLGRGIVFGLFGLLLFLTFFF